MLKAKGYAAPAAKAPLTPFSFERRDPKDHDVVIDIKYCGICHSDIHMVRNEWGMSTLFPMVPGHEIAGVVRSTGSKVTKYKVGDHVGVGCFVDSCRTCANCKQHLDQYCLEGNTMTYGGIERDGKTVTQGGSASLCWNHPLLSANALESRPRQESRHRRNGWTWPYGSEDRQSTWCRRHGTQSF